MHLYNRDGSPCYEVPYKDPSRGMRASTLADARKQGLVPSVTEILRVMAKPGLERWKVQQGIMSALTLPREDETDDAFLGAVMRDSKEKGKIAADKGTEIHGAIERLFQGRTVDSQYWDLAHRVRDAIDDKYGPELYWIAEKSFSHPMGFGGKTDLHEPTKIVLDFKTKEKFSKRMAYDEQVMQLAAYANGLGIPDALLVNMFVQWDGEIEIHEWTPAEAKRGWDGFCRCFELWKWVKKFDPSYEEVEDAF